MEHQPESAQRQRLHSRLRQLILMRETGPKSPRWHAARMRLIWQLHDQLEQPNHPTDQPRSAEPTTE